MPVDSVPCTVPASPLGGGDDVFHGQGRGCAPWDRMASASDPPKTAASLQGPPAACTRLFFGDRRGEGSHLAYSTGMSGNCLHLGLKRFRRWRGRTQEYSPPADVPRTVDWDTHRVSRPAVCGENGLRRDTQDRGPFPTCPAASVCSRHRGTDGGTGCAGAGTSCCCWCWL